MPNPNDPEQADCKGCFDSGFHPGSYTPCRFCRSEEYEKFWAAQSGPATTQGGPHEG